MAVQHESANKCATIWIGRINCRKVLSKWAMLESQPGLLNPVFNVELVIDVGSRHYSIQHWPTFSIITSLGMLSYQRCFSILTEFRFVEFERFYDTEFRLPVLPVGDRTLNSAFKSYRKQNTVTRISTF